MSRPPAAIAVDRAALVRRGLWLNHVTIAYNAIEAIVSLAAGFLSGSVALVGFGFDSVIEVTASVAANWRLRADRHEAHRQRIERATVRIVGWSFIALATYVVLDSAWSLWRRETPERSIAGIGILSLSVIVMPILARAKRNVANALRSNALAGEATQTSLCAYLSVIALVGTLLNATMGWWWADPLAALGMVPIIVREGLEGIRGEACCDDDPSCASHGR